MSVDVLHPYTKFEVRRPSGSKDMVYFGHGIKQPGDLDPIWQQICHKPKLIFNICVSVTYVLK